MIRIFREDDSHSIFVSHGSVGAWPLNCLKAIANPETGTISILNKAKRYTDGSDFFEVVNIAYEQFVDANEVQYGNSLADTTNALNILFAYSGVSGGDPPTITSPLTLYVEDGSQINYFLVASYGVAYEWGNLPAGLGVAPENPRNLIGTIAGGVGTYNISMTATNYFGSDTQTLTIEVVAGFANSLSVNFNNGEYLAVTPGVDCPLHRDGNGSGAADAWSVGLWFKGGSSIDQEQTIFMLGADSDSDGQVCITYDGKYHRLVLCYGSKASFIRKDTADNTVPYDTWRHMLITYDGGTTGSDPGDVDDYYGRFKIYINGVIQVTSDSNGNGGWDDSIIPDRFQVGKRGLEGKFLRDNCKVEELAIWGSDQSANVASIYNSGTTHDLRLLAAPPAHYWRMGDGDVFPTIADNVDAGDFTMWNMTPGSIVTNVP